MNQEFDHQAAQDASHYGRAVEKTVDDSVKLLIEGIHLLLRQRQEKVTLNFDDPTQIQQNVKDAIAAGGDDKTISLFLDQHSSIQGHKKQYPQQNDKLKQTLIQDAKADLLVDKHRNSPSFKQAQKQEQKQKQAQKQGPKL